MGVFAKSFHSKSWEKAVLAHKLFVEGPECNPGLKAVADADLASHPGNPENVKPANNGKSIDPELAELLTQYPDRDAVLKGLASQALSLDDANKVLNALTPARSTGPGKPYTTKGGATVQKNPHPTCLLLRDVTSAGQPRKAPTIMFFILPGKEVKGKGYAGSAMMAVPVVRALVEKHGIGGMFREALAAYDDGTICIARGDSDDDN